MNIRIALLSAIVLPLVACGQGAAPTASAPSSDAAPQPQATAQPAAEPVAAGDPRIALAAKIPGSKPEDLRPTPIPGIFELVHGTDISYVSADAKYVFSGDLYQVSMNGDFPNLSEVRRRELRLARLNEVPESQMIVYGPAKAAHTITVFTDIDCPWCQRMHAQVAEYNRLGIRVRYLFYPRSGPDTESWFKAEAVWCAADRKKALDNAKDGKKVEGRACATQVARDYALGRDIGVNGTPGVVLDTGELVVGYLTPVQLKAHIAESAAAPQAKR